MKKGIKITTASLLAMSALTPVAVFAAEENVVDPGIYTTSGYYSFTEFQTLPTSEKLEILQDESSVIVAGEQAIPGLLILEGTDADIAAVDTTPQQYAEENGVEFTENGIKTPGEEPAPVELAVESVSAINGTVLEGATNITTNASFTVKFNNAISAESVVAENFKLLKGEVLAPVKLTLSDDKKTVTVTPTSSLTASSDYKLVVAKGVKTADGTSESTEAKTVAFKTGDFVTVSALRIGGQAVDTAVVHGVMSTNAQNTSKFQLAFTQKVDPTTVNANNVKIIDKDGNQVPGVVSYDDTSKLVTIELGKTLSLYTATGNPSYTLSADNLKTADGKAIESYSYDFKVSPDYAPVVQLANGTAVNANANVYGKLETEFYAGERKVGFHLNIAFRAVANGEIQAMQADTLNSGNVYLEEVASGAKVDSTLSYNEGSRVLTLTPKTALKENTEYRLVVSKDVRNDLGLKAEAVTQLTGIGGSGVNFGTKVGSTDYKQTFTTGYYVRPVATESSIKQGAVDVEATTNTITVRFDKDLNTTAPGVPTMIANKAIKLIDNSANDEEIHLGTGAGDGQNTATVTVNGNTLSIQLTGKTLENALDKNGLVNGAAYNPTTNNRKGHTFTLVVAGEGTSGASALRDKYGNTLAQDYNLTFSVPATDTVAPTIASVHGIAQADGPGATQHTVELSKTNVVTNVQGAGTAAANESFKVVFSEKMLTGGGANAADLAGNYSLEVDTNNDGTFAPAELVAGAVTVTNPSGDGKTFIVTPSATTDITENVKVRLTVKSNVADLEGNQIGTAQQYVFATGVGPVLSTTDADGGGADVASLPLPFATAATGFPTTGVAASLEGTRNSLLIAFDTLGGNAGNVDATTLTTNNIVVTDKATGEVVAGKLFSDQATTLPVVANTNAVYFKPDAAWASGKTYVVTLKAGIKDATIGNKTLQDTKYEFTVADTQATPTITNVSVGNNDTGVATNSSFTVQFDQPMNEATLAGITLTAADDTYLVPTTGAVDGDAVADVVDVERKYDAATRTLTITPKHALATGTVHTLTIPNTVQATNGNAVQAKTVNFSTSNTATKPNLLTATWAEAGVAGFVDDKLILTFDAPVVRAGGTVTVADFEFSPEIDASELSVTAINGNTVIFTVGAGGNTAIISGGSTVKAGATVLGLDSTPASTATVTIKK